MGAYGGEEKREREEEKKGRERESYAVHNSL